jgi:hypothetical protein
MRPGTLVLLIAAGCANLSETDTGVATLQVLAPVQPVLEVGDTTRLTARALDNSGEDVSATIEWRAPDSTLTVDATGLVTADSVGTGRVQARSESLISNFITFTIILRPDTLVLEGSSAILVPVGQDSTPALVARLDSHHLGDTLPASGGMIVYQIVDPVFPDPSLRTIELSGQILIDTVTTGGGGTPITLVQLWRVTGRTSPDSAIVEIRATRFQGTEVVPGSGQRFIVRFGN